MSQSYWAYSVQHDEKMYVLTAYASATDVKLSEESRNSDRSAMTNILYHNSSISVRDNVKLRQKPERAASRTGTMMECCPFLMYAFNGLLTLSHNRNWLCPGLLRSISSRHGNLRSRATVQNIGRPYYVVKTDYFSWIFAYASIVMGWWRNSVPLSRLHDKLHSSYDWNVHKLLRWISWWRCMSKDWKLAQRNWARRKGDFNVDYSP